MGQPLTTARLDALRAASNAGNRQQYYSLLSSYGYQYGNLALGVVNNSGVSGATANAYAESGLG